MKVLVIAKHFSDFLKGLKTHQELFDLTSKIYKHKIACTTFGIGSDFDEDLMKGIAEYGNSYYFYLEQTEQIERFVSAALGALLGIIGKVTYRFCVTKSLPECCVEGQRQEWRHCEENLWT